MRERLRLNRYLAAGGVASRRRCDDLIRSGRVCVNGERIEALGVRVDPESDVVTFDGARIELPQASSHLVLHKPVGYLVSAVDTRGRPTVMDLVADAPGRIVPVGRLDLNSEGLLFFTSDGGLAYRLAHPKFKVAKLYVVEVAGKVAPGVIEALCAGVLLEEGRTQPARVRRLESRGGRCCLEIELKEGRKRQIRRMLALFGHEVKRLARIRFGPLELGDLAAGSWRSLRPDELRTLRIAAGLEGNETGETTL